MEQINPWKDFATPKHWFDTKHSLRRTLFWSLVAVIFVPMVLVGSVVTSVSLNSNSNLVESKLVAVAILKEGSINRWLDGVSGRLTEPGTMDIAARTLYEFERRPAFEEHLVSRFRHDVMAIRGNSNDFELINLIDKDGVVKASTDENEVGKIYKSTPMFSEGMKDVYIQPLYFDDINQTTTLIISTPVYDADENIVGVLSGKVNLGVLKTILQEATGLGAKSETYLAAQDGTIFDPLLKPRPDSTTETTEGITAGFNNQVGTTLYLNYEGEPVVGSYRPLGKLGTVLLAEQESEEAFASIRRTAFLLLFLTVIIVSGAMYLGYLLTNRIVMPIRDMTSVATEIAQGNLQKTIVLNREDEIGLMAYAFNNMTAQLKDLINTLEFRVKERTAALMHRETQLQTAIKVSNAASTLLESQSLLEQAVNLIKEQFNFYYVGLFLVDEASEWAVLKAGTGEAGRQQLEMNHRLKIAGESMIGWSIANRQARISADVGQETVHYVNPILPETQSEMALPMISRGQVLGALSIQSAERNAFSQEDIDVLQTVADQIAAALQNSTLFADVQSTRTRFEELYQLGSRLLVAENHEAIYRASIDTVKSIQPSWGAMIVRNRQTLRQTVLEIVSLWRTKAVSNDALAVGDRFSVEDMGLQTAFDSGSSNILHILDVNADPRLTDAFRAQLNAAQIGSAIGIPIGRGVTLWGTLWIAHSTPTPFSEEEIHLLEGVAQQMLISIENHTHLEEALNRATQLEAAAEVAKNTTTEINLDALLPKVVDLIQDSFGYYATSIFLIDELGHNAVQQAAASEVGDLINQEPLRLSLKDTSQVTTAINTGKAQIIFDTIQSDTYSKYDLLPDTKTEITLPLMAGGQVIGALDVQSKQPTDFQAGEEVVLQTIADLVANAIYVARLFERERNATAEIENLHQRYLQQEWSAFLQRTDEGRTSFTNLPEALTDTIETWLDDSLPVGQPLVINNEPSAGAESSIEVSDVGVAAPLMLRGLPIGAISLTDNEPRQWSDDDTAIVEAVATQAALAIENARLIEETQRWAAELQTSTDISQSITATLDEKQIIASSLQLIQTNFPFKTTILNLRPLPEDQSFAVQYQTTIENPHAPVTPRRIEVAPHSLTEVAINHQKSVLMQDNAPQPSLHLPAEPDDLHSGLAIPLVVQQNVIGVLELYCHRPNAFSPDVISVFEILGLQLAATLSNAEAYQEQIETAEKLKEVDKLKTQFLANMSHELRTPLNSIIGFSRVILKGIDGPLTKLQKTDLTSIHQSGKHLLDLINNILDLAKIEAGKMDINISPVDLQALVHGITSTAIGLVKDKSVEIIEHVPDDLPTIEGDETRLRQVLLNLVSNAAKFTDEGRITISAHHDANTVSISVTDTGIGIAPEDQSGIFDEFTQVDASTTRRAGGTGLGLPITKKFIELHQGQIIVESQLTEGATFTIVLPISQRQSTEPPRKTGSLPPLPTASTILVIDSDPRITDYYKQYLAGRAFNIVPWSADEPAVETAKALQPHAILLDILLKDEDGWQILTDLKANPHTTHIPVIITSAVDAKARAEEIGVADYLLKPIIKRDLLQAMNQLKKQDQIKRVLVIDDKADDLLLVKRILEAHECQVVQASNGLEGLEIVYKNPPALVILDLTMPELDGFGVLQSLRENPDTSEIPSIVLTAKELTPVEEATLNAQANAILFKGMFTDAALMQYVNQFLQREPAP